MCGFVSEVLNTIMEPLYCAIDGVLQEYENGAVAVEALDGVLRTSHAIKLIGTKNNKICVTIVDRQPEIDESNKNWMTEEEKRTGVEPSFF